MDTKYSQEIERLYMLMFRRLLVYAQCIIKNEALAEEAVQETFRIACQKPEALCSSEKSEGWLLNTLKNVLRNMKRDYDAADRILRAYVISLAEPLRVTTDSIKVEVLYEDLAETEDFNLLVDMAIDGKSHLEMAKARNISLDACKKRVQRAKERLREKINL